MLIKALCDYYDILAEKGDVVEDGFSKQSISYMIFLDSNGNVTGINDIRKSVIVTDKKGKEKVNLVDVDMDFPNREPSTSIKSYNIDHRGRYIFGLDFENNTFSPIGEKNRAKLSHEKFVELNLQYVENLDSPIINAFKEFITNWVPENETENEMLLAIGKNFSQVGFCFALDGHPEVLLNLDNLILSKIRNDSKEKSNDTATQICGISAEKGEIARIHNNVKGLIGQKAGTLVCVNNTSEESYNKSQSYNSNISEDTMKKYVESLNYLLSDKTHKAYVDEMTVAFWAMTKKADKESDMLNSSLFDAEPSEEIGAALSQIMNYTRQGKTFDLSSFDIDENVDFYIAGFTPNSSRISQKFIYHNRFGEIFSNILLHQKDLSVDGSEKQIAVHHIIKELKSPVSSKDTAPPALSAQLFDTIINGKRYPTSLLATIIRRVKTDSDDDKNKFIKFNRTRIGIIKACINRNARFLGKEEEIKMSLDKENTCPAYLCGRLFAVLEKIQKEALGEVNSTIKDSYFATACSKPATVFPKLMMLSQHHLSKIKGSKENDYSGYFNYSIGEIIGMIGTEFPKTLSLEEQGKFIIGYYHQMFAKKSSDKETES